MQAKGATHTQLFSIRQLLALREAIAPFEADFAVVERDLGESFVRVFPYLQVCRPLRPILQLWSATWVSAVFTVFRYL